MTHRIFKSTAVIALALTGALLMQPASAQRHGGWHGGPGFFGLGLGLGLGWELAYAGGLYPYGYYPYPAYPAYPVYPAAYPAYPYAVAAPALYPAAPAAAPAPQPRTAPANWYYCDSSKAYYPYVSQCAEGWRAVPSVPPGAVR